jgi:hypothetical protein
MKMHLKGCIIITSKNSKNKVNGYNELKILIRMSFLV